MRPCPLFGYVACLLIAGSLLACSDHRISAVTPGSAAGRLRVKTITQNLPNNVAKVTTFGYDAQGRLSSLFTYQSPDSTASDLEFGTYLYDGQNHLVQFRHVAVPYPRGQSNRYEQYDYTYNGAGLVTSLAYLGGYSLTFSYNSANQLASDTRQFSTGGLSLSGTNSFTFTAGNLTTLSDYRTLPLRGPSGNSQATVAYTYDDKVNPFYGLFLIPAAYPEGFVNFVSSPRTVQTYFGGTENVLNLSQNNVLSEAATITTTIAGSVGTSTTTTTYQYAYNTANLPTQRQAYTDGALTQTLRFTYESY